MSKSARQSAFEILYKVERSGAYSNLALDAQLSSKDGADGESALLTALVYGVLERLITLDYNISLYLRQPLKSSSRRYSLRCASALISCCLWTGFLRARQSTRA